MASQVLVDFGADIVRVDRPGATRTPGELVRLRGRRSIAVDLDRDESAVLLDRLLQGTDVLITEPGLDGIEPLMAAYDELAAKYPRLIWCRINGYGDDGPLAGAWTHDHLIAARYGVYDQPGFREGPTFVTGQMPSMGAGLLAAQAIGSALYQREKTGLGQELMVSLLAGALTFLPTIISASIDPPGGNPPAPARRPAGAAPFYSIYECADGRYLHFGCLTVQFRKNATAAIDRGEAIGALGLDTPAGRANSDAITDVVAERMKQRTFDEWAATFEAQDVPYAESTWTEDLLDNEQVAHEGLAVTVEDPTAGPMLQMGPIAVVEGYEWRTPLPAPLAGEHTAAICSELGYSDAEIADLRRNEVVA